MLLAAFGDTLDHAGLRGADPLGHTDMCQKDLLFGPAYPSARSPYCKSHAVLLALCAFGSGV